MARHGIRRAAPGLACAQVSFVFSAGTYLAVLGLQVPLCMVAGANIGWCFGYAVGCADTAQKLRALAVCVVQPVLGALQAALAFGFRRLGRLGHAPGQFR